MDDFKSTHRFISEKALTDIEKLRISEYFNKTKGIVSIEIASNEITLLFYKHLHTVDSLEKELKDLKISIYKEKAEKNFLKRFIRDLAKNNRQNLVTGSLDCCELNRK